MSRIFSTNNRYWYPVKSPNGKPGSERMELYRFIAEHPGISSARLVERWMYPTSMRSRLKELSDHHYIRSQLINDLFRRSIL